MPTCYDCSFPAAHRDQQLPGKSAIDPSKFLSSIYKVCCMSNPCCESCINHTQFYAVSWCMPHSNIVSYQSLALILSCILAKLLILQVIQLAYHNNTAHPSCFLSNSNWLSCKANSSRPYTIYIHYSSTSQRPRDICVLFPCGLCL